MIDAYPWHDEVLADIDDRAHREVLPSAIGLSCAEGWGGRSLLVRVAKQLLGVTKQINPEEFAHPDFRWIVPDGAVIKIDQIRALNAFAVQTPQMAKRKVAAVLNAHLLNPNAANTLLKTLEEPPANTHILLCTPYWSRLLPTIRSRCQCFQIKTNEEQAKQWLAKNHIELTQGLFAQAGYAPLSLQDQTVDLESFVARILSAKALGALVDEAIEANPAIFLGGWYRLLIAKQHAGPSRSLLAFAEELNDARRMIETSNSTNIRLALERLFFLWQQINKQPQVG